MTDVARAYRTRDRNIAHERLDDEVIAIDLSCGAYFAMTGSAADIWTAIVDGLDAEHVVQVLARRYEADPDAVRDDVDVFVVRLVDEGLLVADAPDEADTPGGPDGTDLPTLPALPDGERWQAPDLERYEDMADLVLLDPIHDADESGWPQAAADS